MPLFARLPDLAPHLPRVVLGDWPTPLTPLPALAKGWSLDELLVKRDDISGVPYGGSKLRKLEFLLGAAKAAGKVGVVAVGGVGSHHAAATSIYAAKVGLNCKLFLLPQPPTDEVRRVLLTAAKFGADVTLVGTLRGARRATRKLGDDWFAMKPGGSSVIGNMGFINAGLEFAAQVNASPNEHAVVFIPVGTMGSAVGLAIGLELAGAPITIVGVRTSSWSASSPRTFHKLYDETVAWMRQRVPSLPDLALSPTRMIFEDRYLGGGYAVPTTAGAKATITAATHGLRLDATYSAKAFAAMRALVGNGSRASSSGAGSARRIIFWHTHSHHPLADLGDVNDLPKSLRSYARDRH